MHVQRRPDPEHRVGEVADVASIAIVEMHGRHQALVIPNH